MEIGGEDGNKVWRCEEVKSEESGRREEFLGQE
jgi:hypothetical protein